MVLAALSGAAEPAKEGVVDLSAHADSAEPESKIQFERGKASENLEEAAEAFKAAIKRDPGGPWAQMARLELGKQEYALGRAESAMVHLEAVPEDGLTGENKAQLLYWRAQCRFVLKGFTKSQEDFESFLRLYPEHALADSASLAVADCDAALRHDDAAFTGYKKLYQAPASSVAPQAYLQAAALHLKSGRKHEARLLLEKVAKDFPESLEAGRAKEELKSLPKAEAATPTPQKAVPEGAAAFTIQVGAYSRHAGALALFNKLKKRGYPVRLDKQVIKDSVFHLVQIGKYPKKAQAQKAADRIKARERLPVRIVEMKTP
jgi:TolA-binding protein